ncbi:hypothetical protein B9Z55_022621 [Caenorhabditis nigoni]|uniref:Nuclear receptor domain-containing protein n=1 Tax=Caenorhabditis nigoni TaxID=1611254 RepID=A0A2G5SLG9_9PELO|nr:hypothetical protein B9Z55_022621 [Caenorhabditis nigoni]
MVCYGNRKVVLHRGVITCLKCYDFFRVQHNNKKLLKCCQPKCKATSKCKKCKLARCVELGMKKPEREMEEVEEDSRNQSRAMGSQSMKEKSKSQKKKSNKTKDQMSKKNDKNAQKLEISLPDVDHLPVDQKVEQLMKCLICTEPSPHVKFGYALCRSCSNFYRHSNNKKLLEYCKPKCQDVLKCRKCRLRKCFELGMKLDKKDPEREVEEEVEEGSGNQSGTSGSRSKKTRSKYQKNSPAGNRQEEDSGSDCSETHSSETDSDEDSEAESTGPNDSFIMNSIRENEIREALEIRKARYQPNADKPSKMVRFFDEIEIENRRQGTSGFSEEGVGSTGISDSGGLEASEPKEGPSEKIPNAFGSQNGQVLRDSGSQESHENSEDSSMVNDIELDQPDDQEKQEHLELVQRSSEGQDHQGRNTEQSEKAPRASENLENPFGVSSDDDLRNASETEQIQEAAGGQDGQDEVPGIEENQNVNHEASDIQEDLEADENDGQDGLVEEASRVLEVAKDNQANGIQEGQVGGQGGQVDGSDEHDEKQPDVPH